MKDESGEVAADGEQRKNVPWERAGGGGELEIEERGKFWRREKK